jgi:hypothetical protein
VALTHPSMVQALATWPGSPNMKKISLVILASVALVSVGACAGVGKGKGKAPPPAASPVITKG